MSTRRDLIVRLRLERMKKLKADRRALELKGLGTGAWVSVAMIGGKMPAVIVDGRSSRSGYMKVRIAYGPFPITGYSYGAPRRFHLEDITRAHDPRPKNERKPIA